MKKVLMKIVSIVLVLVMVNGLAACGSSDTPAQTTAAETQQTEAQTKEETKETASEEESTEPESKEPVYHELTVGTATATSTMTPFGTWSTGICEKAVYEQLATLESVESEELVGELAKEWHTTDDGTTWEVTIYDNIYDSEGNHITAEDVNFCANERIGIATMAKCVSCEVVDEYTVRLVLVNNGLGTLNAVMNGFNIVSKAAYEASPDGMATTPVGTGPYVCTDFVAGAYVTIEKNENYWQQDDSLKTVYAASTVDKITFVTIQEAAQQTIALETGTVDAMNNITATEIGKFDEGGQFAADFTLSSTPLKQFYMTNFSGDPTSPFSDDLNLRLAVAYAIDVDGLIVGAMDGRATKINYLGMPSFPDNPTEPDEYFDYDVDKAKDYLSKSNYAGQTIRIVCQNSGSYSRIAQIIANFLNAIGITTEVSAYDNAMWQTAYSDPTQYDMVVCQIGSSDYLVNAWQTPFSTQPSTGKSKAGWDDPELKELIATVIEPDGHTQENLDKLQDLVNDKMYALAYFYGYSCNVWKNDTNIESVPVGCKVDLIWWGTVFND